MHLMWFSAFQVAAPMRLRGSGDVLAVRAIVPRKKECFSFTRAVVILYLGAICSSPMMAMDCPDPPQQVSKDTKVAVEVAVGRIGPVKAAEANIAVNRATVDLLKSIPRADRVYLEQMMFAAYCSSIRDAAGISDAEKARSVREYAKEVRRALELQQGNSPVQRPATPDSTGKPKPEQKSSSRRVEDEFLAYEKQRKINGSAEFFRANAPLRYRSWLAEANTGSSKAQVLVGLSLFRGDGIEKNVSEAVSWFQKAADAGEAAAHFNLGWAYEDGLGVPEDKQTALIFYREAAKRQHSAAIVAIGRFHRWGLGGLAQNSNEAISWLERAARLGEAHAAYDLGGMYEYGGPNLAIDVVLSDQWYKTAASMGHQTSRGLLASRELAQSIAKYSRPMIDDSERSAAVGASRIAMRDLEFVSVESLVEALGQSGIQTAIESVRQRGAADPMAKVIEDAVAILIEKFRRTNSEAKTRLFARFGRLSQPILTGKREAGRHREVYESCRDILKQVDLTSLTSGEQDGTIKLVSDCAVSMVVLGYRQDAIRLADSAFALIDKIGVTKPWDWYLYDGERNLGWNVGAALADVGENGKSQEYLKRAWDNSFVLFGREDMIGRYSALPVKGGIPKEVAAADREFFEGYAKTSPSASKMTRFTIPMDFAGISHPFHVYVVAGRNGYRKLQDQFVWVSEYRGGTVPAEVVDSFHRLNKIAIDNNVDFRDICVYAMGRIGEKTETGDGKKVEADAKK